MNEEECKAIHDALERLRELFATLNRADMVALADMIWNEYNAIYTALHPPRTV